MKKKTLGVGIIGGGFNARFHIRGCGVRDADILGIYDPESKSGPRRRSVSPASSTWARPETYKIDHRYGGRPEDRRHLDLLPEFHPDRGHGGDRPRPREGKGRARSASAVKSRSAGTSRRPGGCSSWSVRLSSSTATSRTRSSRLRSSGARASSGRGARRSPAGPTWPGRPRSTAGRTCPGSGRGASRAAASSTT